MERQQKEEWVQAAAWGLALAVCILAVTTWGAGWHWQFGRFSAYKLFPLFGLLAFSLMWTHYMAGSLRRLAGLPKTAIKSFLRITGWAVLVLICLHPGLLVWQLWRDGFGLPPGSYLYNYVAPHLEWVALLGTVSLGVFLAYEAKRWFDKKSWWKWVAYASDIAMLAVFYHGLQLGRNLRVGWFRNVWLVYGITLVVALIYIHLHDRRSARSQAIHANVEG